MKPMYVLLSVVLLCALKMSAQQPLDDYKVPVLRLVPGQQRVPALSYMQSQPVTDVELAGTPLSPKAHGSVKVEPARGGLKLEVHLGSLPPASELDPAYLTYVVWAIPTDRERPVNLGELVRKGEEGSVSSFTNLPTFALVVTAEPYFAVEQPSPLIVAQNVVHKLSDPNVVRADLLPLRMDSKTPLDIYEARNAVRIARKAGAERYAAEPFRKAVQLLQQAESIFARKKGQDIPDVKAKARAATEAAEQARATAVQQDRQNTASHLANEQP